VAAEQDGRLELHNAAQGAHHTGHVLVEARGLNGGDCVNVTEMRL
jgi:hypothetical protein